jgi:hypothetical protein
MSEIGVIGIFFIAILILIAFGLGFLLGWICRRAKEDEIQ